MRYELLWAAEVQGTERTLEAVASLACLLSALLRDTHPERHTRPLLTPAGSTVALTTRNKGDFYTEKDEQNMRCNKSET